MALGTVVDFLESQLPTCKTVTGLSRACILAAVQMGCDQICRDPGTGPGVQGLLDKCGLLLRLLLMLAPQPFRDALQDPSLWSEPPSNTVFDIQDVSGADVHAPTPTRP